MSAIISAFFTALSALARNKLRAVLTLLGILIGTAAFVIVWALGSGASSFIGGKVSDLGSNLLYIFPQPTQASGARGKASGRITEDDGKAIEREAVSVAGVADFLTSMAQVVVGDKNVQTEIDGVNIQYFWIRKFEIERGTIWSDTDASAKSKVCVLGPTVATNLFGTDDPVGHTIRINSAPYTVVGVTKARGSSLFGEDQDDRIFMPIGSFRARVLPTPPGHVGLLMAAATSEDTTSNAKRQITSILHQRHGIREDAPDDFQIRTQEDLQETQRSITESLRNLLIGIATVSLVVGGIGIMNIMLVSVAERTREIGIRLSIGARENDILVQFLVEAVVLSLFGGALGMVLGSAIVVALGQALGWAMRPDVGSLLFASGISAVVGVVFGFLPARRAAKLDPIEALRVE